MRVPPLLLVPVRTRPRGGSSTALPACSLGLHSEQRVYCAGLERSSFRREEPTPCCFDAGFRPSPSTTMVLPEEKRRQSFRPRPEPGARRRLTATTRVAVPRSASRGEARASANASSPSGQKCWRSTRRRRKSNRRRGWAGEGGNEMAAAEMRI